MKYTKPALSFEQQAQRLIDRGLIVQDKAALVESLKAVNYYRLSAYWYPFKQDTPAGERFAPGTTFEMIWRRYTLDRELRLLVMDAIEHIEVAILRTRMVEQFTRLHTPFGYDQRRNFNPKFTANEHAKLLADIDEAVNRSKEEFVQRFRLKYTSEKRLPLWMAAEVMSFGNLFTMFRNLHRAEQQMLSRQFGVSTRVMLSWLHTLNFVRNACAHHSRLWSREFPIRPRIPDKSNNPEWHHPAVKFSNERVFATLTLLKFLLAQIAPNIPWQNRLEKLLDEYADIPRHLMGFPSNWKELSVWHRDFGSKKP